MDEIGSITKAKVRPELIQSVLAPAEAVAQGGEALGYGPKPPERR